MPFKAASEAIAKSAVIGEGTVIQPNVFLGNNVVIGKLSYTC
jgi:UDP-3-O-[3-hydroxymyristoyl] glucosamine N-acyltransferase